MFRPALAAVVMVGLLGGDAIGLVAGEPTTQTVPGPSVVAIGPGEISPAVVPDFAKLQRALIAAAVPPSSESGRANGFRQIALLGMQKSDRLVPGKDVFVVWFEGVAEWWKENRTYVAVLHPEGDGLAPLFVYCSSTCKGLDYRIVDLDDCVPDPKATSPNQFLRQDDLLVQEDPTGNSATANRTLIFRHNPKTGSFEGIFNLPISFTSLSRNGVCGYESELEFVAAKGRRLALKDIVIKTRIVPADAHSAAAENPKIIETVYRWDGERYSGNFSLPDEVRWHRELADEMTGERLQ